MAGGSASRILDCAGKAKRRRRFLARGTLVQFGLTRNTDLFVISVMLCEIERRRVSEAATKLKKPTLKSLAAEMRRLRDRLEDVRI